MGDTQYLAGTQNDVTEDIAIQVSIVSPSDGSTWSKILKDKTGVRAISGMYINSLGSAVGLRADEIFGKTAGSYIENSITDGLIGAMQLGVASGNIFGVLAGGILGTVNGLIKSGIQETQEKNNAFATFTNNVYSDIVTKRGQTTQRGLDLQDQNIDDYYLSIEDQLAKEKAQGYSEKYDKQINLYTEDEKKKLKLMYRLQGQKEAELENEQNKAIQSGIKDILSTISYESIVKNTGESIRAVEVATEQASLEFRNSELMQTENALDATVLKKLHDWGYDKLYLWYEDYLFQMGDPLAKERSRTWSTVNNELHIIPSSNPQIGPSEDIMTYENTLFHMKYTKTPEGYYDNPQIVVDQDLLNKPDPHIYTKEQAENDFNNFVSEIQKELETINSFLQSNLPLKLNYPSIGYDFSRTITTN